MRLVDLGPLVELRWRIVEMTKSGRERVIAGFVRESEADAYRMQRERAERRLKR